MRIVLFSTTFLYSFLLFIEPLNAEEPSALVLPPMTVFGIKKSDTNYTQRSEVAWNEANDATIVRQQDGAYTVKSTTSPFNLNTLLASLGSPTVNIDFGYAINSSSLNADGNSTLRNLLEALKYWGEEVTLQVTPTVSASDELSRSLMLRRLEVLKEMLVLHTHVTIKFAPVRTLRGDSKLRINQQAGFDVWRIRVRRLG